MQYFSLSTNVNELRIGNNSSKNIGKEIGKFVVSTIGAGDIDRLVTPLKSFLSEIS